MSYECYESIDYVSLHRYYDNSTNNTPGLLARAMDMEDVIKTVVASYVCFSSGNSNHWTCGYSGCFGTDRYRSISAGYRA